VNVGVVPGEFGTVAAASALTDVSPYLTVTVAAAPRVRLDTVIVHGPVPATAIVPDVVVVYPAALLVVVCGAVQPFGTTIVIAPAFMPPVAAV
jgi:hypothetical protein